MQHRIPFTIEIILFDVYLGESRLCFHGVPKIIRNPKFNLYRQPSIESGRWWTILDKMRLNLNVRQVNDYDNTWYNQ